MFYLDGENMINKLKLSITMLIFGTIGIFVKHIPLSSGVIAMTRGYLGAAFLLAVMLIRGKKPEFTAIKRNLVPLALSGAAIGVNWIFLFEAYNYTSVAVATLCYYMQPVMLIVLTPFVLGEKLSKKKLLCVPVALLGMVMVSGVLSGPQNVSVKGVVMGLLAAVFYTTVIIINRFLKDINSYDSTLVQLFTAALVITPYNVAVGMGSITQIGLTALILLFVVGIVHTGFAYSMYFGCVNNISTQTVAIFSYIDPAFSILLSVFLLGEGMDVWGVVGAVLILGAAILSELVTDSLKKE